MNIFLKNTDTQRPNKKFVAGGGPHTYNPLDFHCGIDDSPPVDTNKLWKDEPNCFDYEGNIQISSMSINFHLN